MSRPRDRLDLLAGGKPCEPVERAGWAMEVRTRPRLEVLSGVVQDADSTLDGPGESQGSQVLRAAVT